MAPPWQPLLDWWFGSAKSPDEIAADKGKLWFGKRHDRQAQERFGDQVEQALAGGLTDWPPCVLDKPLQVKTAPGSFSIVA